METNRTLKKRVAGEDSVKGTPQMLTCWELG